MESAQREGRGPSLCAAVRVLIGDGLSSRGVLPSDAPERDFYLGVEAAAEQVLRPEMTSTRTTSWLERQVPMFQDGYIKTTDLMAAVAVSDRMPLHLRMPTPG